MGTAPVRAALALFGLVAVLLFPSSSFSQALPVGVSPVFAPTVTPTGFAFSGGSATAANAANIAFANAANGAVYAENTVRMSLGGGASADFVMRSTPTALEVAGALGRFAVKTAGVFAVGYALYDLAKELGFNFGRDSVGNITVTRDDPTVCSVAPCYLYTVNNHPASASSSAQDSCTKAAVADYGAGSTGVLGNGVTFCYMYNAAGTYRNGLGIVQSSVAPSPAVTTASTVQSFTDAVAAKSGWPSTSAINRALKDAVASGQVLPLPAPQTITGPLEVPLAPKVVTNPDGTTVTTTPKKVLTYSPPGVTVSDSTSTVTKSATGTVTATTGEAKPADLPQTCGYPGGPPCKIDETGTPDGKDTIKTTDLEAQWKKMDDRLTQTTSGGIGAGSGLDTSWGVTPWWLSGGTCHPAQLMSFPAKMNMSPVMFDICPQLPTIYTLMNLIWVSITFGAVIAMVLRVTTNGAV